MQFRSVSMEKLINFGKSYLISKGADEADASYITGVIVTIEAMGVHTHGLTMFPYFESLIPEELNPKAKPEIVKEKGASALIDAKSGFAQLAMKLARETAVKKAKEQGIAMIAVKNALWMGAVGVYLIPLALQGYFAQIWAQTSTCTDCAPYGGIEGTFSTNPVGFAFPIKPPYAKKIIDTLEELSANIKDDVPIVVSDFSTASMSMGKANTLISEGLKASEEVFLDSRGRLTNDPAVIKEGGTLLFFGGKNYGYKGYGMSLWCEALTAMGGGSANNPESKTRQSINLTVIDPEAFEGTDYYYKEIERFKNRVKMSKLRPRFKEIRFPGERGLKQLKLSQEKGVEVNSELLSKLNGIASKYGMEEIK